MDAGTAAVADTVMIVAGLLLARITRHPLRAEGTDSLRAAVVELVRVADDDGPKAQDEEASAGYSLGHLLLPSVARAPNAGLGESRL
jgi:hypothetical protein